MALMKRPASSPRPGFSKKPVKHCGGRIYFANAKKAFRAYLRTQDKVEARVQFLGDHRSAFTYSCALIEADGRPIK